MGDDEKKKEADKSPLLRDEIEHERRRVERIDTSNRRRVSQGFTPLLPSTRQQNDPDSRSVVDTNCARTVYSPFIPLFPRRHQRDDRAQYSSVNRSIRRQLFPPRESETFPDQPSASSSVDLVVRPNASQEIIIPIDSQQNDDSEDSSVNRSIRRQLFPPRENETFPDQPSASSSVDLVVPIDCQQDDDSEDSSVNSREDEALPQQPSASSSSDLIDRPHASPEKFIYSDCRKLAQPIFHDENTRMSIDGDSQQPFVSNRSDDERTFSWQKGLNFLNIESSESGDVIQQQKESKLSPIPKKRFKLNFTEEQRSENISQDILSTSGQDQSNHEESDMQQAIFESLTTGFKVPQQPLSTTSKIVNEPLPSTSRQADLQDAALFNSVATSKPKKPIASRKKTTQREPPTPAKMDVLEETTGTTPKKKGTPRKTPVKKSTQENVGVLPKNTLKKTPTTPGKRATKSKTSTPRKVDKQANDDDDDDDDDDDNVKKQTKFTIKTTLSDFFCCCPELRELIFNQVKVLSRMTILVVIFVNFALRHPTNNYVRKKWTEKGPNYLEIFPLFKRHSNLPHSEEGREFRNKLRDEFIPEFTAYMGREFELFDCTNLNSQIQQMAKQLNVNYLTNLQCHARNRLATFFKHELFTKPETKNKSEEKQDKKANNQRYEERQRVRRERKLIRRRRNKRKRERWAKKKRKLKRRFRQDRIARRAELEALHPDEPHVEKLIYRHVKKSKRPHDVLQRKIVYDSTPNGRNRGAAYRNRLAMKYNNPNWKKPSPAAKKASNLSTKRKSPISEDEELLIMKVTDDEVLEINRGEIIKTMLDKLFKFNECDNEAFKALNVDNLDFRDIKKRKQCHKFLIFFHDLQGYFSREGIKSFILAPIMKAGLKYVTYTNTGLKELEKELMKIAPDYVTVSKAQEVFTPDEISKQEVEHKRNITPLKEQFKLLEEERTTLGKNVQLLERDPVENGESLLAMKHRLQEIAKQLTPIKKSMKLESQRYQQLKHQRRPGKLNENDDRWNNMFDIAKLRVNKARLKFSNTIMTDGVAVSVIFDLVEPKIVPNFSPSEQPESRDLTQYDVFKGLDPGLKFAFGGVERRKMTHDFDIDCEDSHIKISTKSYRWQTQENKRRSVLHNATKDYKQFYHNLQVSEKYRDKVNHKDPAKILISTEYLLTTFYRMQPYLEKRKVAALRWDKYISVQRESDYLANYMVGNHNRKQLIAIGSPKISPWMKGHVRMPLRKVVRRLIEKQSKYRNLRIVFVDEHRTTRLCSSCNQRMTIFRNRTAYCDSCKISWNRDVNAGRNILNLALVRLGIVDKILLPHWDQFRALCQH